MPIGFYFSGSGGTLQLPVNPAELTVKYQGNNQVTEVVKLGQINILRDRKLAALSLDCLLPGDDYYPFVTGQWRPPEQIVKYFRDALEEKRPLRFVVSEFSLNMQMSVESVSEQRVAGDHESIMCSLSLLQYRSYAASVLVIKPTATASGASSKGKRESNKSPGSTYTVKSGDSFWRIAQQQLGDGSRYGEVASLNGMTAASVIHPGDILKLPVK
jgi:nucleoid-associated protein YgaU